MKRKWLKRLVWTLGSVLLLFLLLFLFRVPILRGIGNFLIEEDPSSQADLAFVLGGNSLDRGKKAAALYQEGMVPKMVCLGANVPSVLRAFDIDSSESEISARIVRNEGVPAQDVRVLEKGRSTKEEAAVAFRYCKRKGVDTAIVLSDKFHLRRVRYVFEPRFESSETHLVFRGASSSRYKESEWWRSEEGMIMVNNEYMKWLYYILAK